jgi:hypothetical protein
VNSCSLLLLLLLLLVLLLLLLVLSTLLLPPAGVSESFESNGGKCSCGNVHKPNRQQHHAV